MSVKVRWSAPLPGPFSVGGNIGGSGRRSRSRSGDVDFNVHPAAVVVGVILMLLVLVGGLLAPGFWWIAVFIGGGWLIAIAMAIVNAIARAVSA